ncbi:MAG: DUF975 family protein [Acholeplasmataceae bacterium]|nr:DUF975 family protein [Acholeplasmataceae bacterium]
MKTSYELRALAREQLKPRYWWVLLFVLIVAMVPSATSVAAVGFIIMGPLLVGQAYYLIDIIENNAKGDRLEFLFEGFKKSFLNSFIASLLAGIFIFLWSLLFIIPGIIKAFAYSMVPYIIAEEPEIDAVAAITKSRELMNGNKMRLFFLFASFIGWFILCLFTLGIGFLFLMPYIQMSVANFYIDIRGRKIVTAQIVE